MGKYWERGSKFPRIGFLVEEEGFIRRKNGPIGGLGLIQPVYSTLQIVEHLEALGSGISVKCALIGGVDNVQQIIGLGNRPHVVLATPGRLLDHLSNTKVLDEVHRLLNEDFEKAVNEILRVKKLQSACLRNLVKARELIKHTFTHILTGIYRRKLMVFTCKYDESRSLALVLRNLGFRAIPINGEMSQAKRLGALNMFKVGECNILVCTMLPVGT
ncbi:hypothetical protein LguiA_024788 [Lonicera macranthoides]